MAELLPQDRLQPSLLDRLTDDEPDKRVEPPERRVLTIARLRESVLRDLNWLFNSTQMASASEMEEFPLVTSSVVNFGLPAFGHDGLERRTANDGDRAASGDSRL